MKNTKIILCGFLIFILSTNLYSQSGWQLLNPSPTSYGYGNIKMLNDNTGIAVGEPNIISKTTDAGESWILKSADIPLEINGVDLRFHAMNFINSSTGFIAGTFLAKTVNSGETWTLMEPLFQHPIVAVKFVNENTGYIFSDGFYKTTNGGLSWINILTDIFPPANPNQEAYPDFINANTGCIASTKGIIYRTTNGGENWVSVLNAGPENQFGGIILNGSAGMTVTKKGKVFKSNDFGQTWAEAGTTPNVNPAVYSYLKILSENSIILTADNLANGIFFRTTNSGNTWEDFNPGTPNIMNDFSEAPNGNIFQATAGGLIYKSTNSGSSWNCKTSNLGDVKNLTAVKFLNANTGFIGGDKGLILKTTNAGLSFSKTYLNTENNISTIELTGNTGYAYAQPYLFKTTDAGISWTAITKSNSISFNKMVFLNSNTGLAAAYTPSQGTGVYKTTDGGFTWIKILGGEGTNDLFMINASQGFYYSRMSISFPHGQQNITELYKTTDAGNSWQYVTRISNLYASAFGFINAQTGFITSPVHNIYKTTDGGVSWNETPYNSYCTKVQFVNQLTGYAGPDYKTTNAGETWFHQDCNARWFDYVSEDIGFSAGFNGLIMRTTDGGGKPLAVQSISETAEGYSLAQNYPNPFNPETKIQFSVPKSGLVKVIVFDLLGREVKELVNEFKQQGIYSVSFNGGNFSSGIYFYKLVTGEFVATKKMILVK